MKALVVDDNSMVRELLKASLSRLGIAADEAKNGAEALAILQHSDYTIIISDIDMPILNGIDLFQNISQKLPHMACRFIFCTGADMLQHTAFFRSFSGAVISKPFSLATLESAVIKTFGKLIDEEHKSSSCRNTDTAAGELHVSN